MKFFINGTDLNRIGVVQNEVGRYYYNGTSYYKPWLKNFDNAVPPAGYKTYTNGSHASYLYQKALDFSYRAGGVITMDEDVKILSKTYTDGSYCKVQTSRGNIFFVHTYKWRNVGDLVKAGQAICQIAPENVSGVPPHLHIFKEGGKVRDLILVDNSMIAIGKRVEFTKVTNLRHDPTKPTVDAKIQVGAVATVIGGPRKYPIDNVSYTFWDVKFNNEQGWAYDGNMKVTTKAQTNVDGSSPPPPKTCEQRLAELKKSLDASWKAQLDEERAKHLKTQKLLAECNGVKKDLETQLATVKTDLGLCMGRNEFLEIQAEADTNTIKALTDDKKACQDKNTQLVKDNEKLKEELALCKEGNDGCLTVLSKLFKRDDGLSLGLKEGTSEKTKK